MPSAPRPSSASLREVAERYVVLLGDKNGDAPTVDDEAPWLIPLSASLTAGGSRLDTLSFSVDLARAEIRLQDTTVPVGYHRQVELRRLDEDGEPTEIVAWGMIAANSQEIELKEQVGITARVDRFVFGDVLKTSTYWDPIGAQVIKPHLPVVFNPEVDDVIQPNRSDKTAEAADGDYSLFFHPESHRLPGAIALQEQVAEEWTLSEAAHWLIWNCNPQEKYIDNPTLDDLQAAFAGHDVGQLKNFSLPFGRYLPELLDALLTPFSFGWYLVHTLDDDVRKTTFKFYRRGDGPKVSLYQQPPGETIDPVKTTTARISASYDITRLANVVVGRAGFKLYESTFPLIPGWEPGDDAQEFAKLDQGEALFKTYPFAYRKFVLNEAGDYNGTRPEITGHYPLIGDIGDSDLVIRRRKFQRCISEHTSDDDAESNGLVLEWWSSIQEGATSPTDPDDPGWIRARWPFRLLEKECGILCTGPTPPQELYDLFQTGFDQVHLRLTAVLESDYALESVAESRPSSPNGEDVTLFLGVKDRFHFRNVTIHSRFDGEPADDRDDQTALDNYCQAIRDQQDAAEVSLSVGLKGLNHPEYKIGQLIDKVEGRNLTFNANKPATGQPRRLQIVGKNLTFAGGQKTELLIETFELERADVGATL